MSDLVSVEAGADSKFVGVQSRGMRELSSAETTAVSGGFDLLEDGFGPGMGTIGGAVVGEIIGGPLGAVVGAVAGAIVGALSAQQAISSVAEDCDETCCDPDDDCCSDDDGCGDS